MHLAGVRSELFERSESELDEVSLSLVIRIRFDFTGIGPRVDFDAAMLDVEAWGALSYVEAEIARLKMLLEDNPVLLLTAPLPAGRLVVQMQPPQCVFDGGTYDLDPEAAAVLTVLVDANGVPVSLSTMKKRFPTELLGVEKVARIKKKMPHDLQKILRSKRGVGWWLDLSLQGHSLSLDQSR